MANSALGHHQQRLLWDTEAMLRCKVCQKRITPPVVICRRGHCTCKECNPKNNYLCLVCNKFLISKRFVMLERLLHVIPRSCKFSRDGCTQVVKGDSNHETFCLKRPNECELGKDSVCGWKGSYENWLKHARSHAHLQVTWWNSVNNLMFIQYLGFPSKWEFYNMLLSFESKLFMISSFKSEEFLHITVKYVGQTSDSYSPPNLMPGYRMKITFLRDSIFDDLSFELISTDDKLAMCEDVPLSELAPLVNSHQELDMCVELSVENQPYIPEAESLSSARQNAAEVVQDFDLIVF